MYTVPGAQYRPNAAEKPYPVLLVDHRFKLYQWKSGFRRWWRWQLLLRLCQTHCEPILLSLEWCLNMLTGTLLHMRPPEHDCNVFIGTSFSIILAELC